MNYRFYADFTGADPRYRDPPKKEPCQTDGAEPAWDAPKEPLRSSDED